MFYSGFILSLEEKYSRVMKYGEDRVNVTVYINDVDKMVSKRYLSVYY